ncbi:MAG TPA: class I tRNA ligase family protein [Solirubrobacterales bacterium]|jgi:leucyl-tRNA synthetase|nr:class I tRNA ligase family protein [Solirubrobacterales bacterium]
MSETARKPPYEPAEFEPRRQAAWVERGDYSAPTPPPDGEHGVYVKSSSPFTSGNLHMGHVRDYTIGDAYARFQRSRGRSVLMGFGFDAFGLPAELAAIERQVPAAEWVVQSGERMLVQMKRLGYSFDYDRVFYSSDESQYRWSQWLFLTLYDMGLIYLDDATVDWCDTCQTTLATIQVEEGGTCWRCHNEVRLIRQPTWFLKITDYLEENDANMAKLEAQPWDELALNTQRYILGRTDGVEFELDGPAGPLTVFTPHADAAGLATFVMFSPRHPEIDGWIADEGVREELDQLRSGGWERSARDARSVPVVDTGRSVLGPGGERLPVLISPLVDARFGPTAALGIPAVDEADADVAARFPHVDAPKTQDSLEKSAHQPEAPRAPVEGARVAKRYRANDFSISRQRSWGTPIPIVHCPDHGPVPVPEADLPVVLPRDLVATGEGNPLAERGDFVDVACPKCGKPAKRETDTLDCHFDALFLWIPATVPPEDRAEQMFTHPESRKWLPAERQVAGADSGGFVFDQRVVTKALRDHGELDYLVDGEPFAGVLFHEMVISDGRKMSKHLGNVVDPDELVGQFGADTVRVAVLWAAGPAKTLNWSDAAVRFANKFLRGFWTYAHDRFVELDGARHDPEKAAETEKQREKLRGWCENGLARIADDTAELQMHKSIRDLTRLFERIQQFEKQLKKRGQLDRVDAEALVAAILVLARALQPFAPHAAEQILLDSGRFASADLPGDWPDATSIPVAVDDALSGAIS